MFTLRQSRQLNMQRRQLCCHWCLRVKRMEYRRQVAFQREENGERKKRYGAKGQKERARKRALLGPRWFQRNPYNSFVSGDDGTRTRDLCRDSGPPSSFR